MNIYLIVLIGIGLLALAAGIKAWLESKAYPQAIKETIHWALAQAIELVKGFVAAPLKTKLIATGITLLVAWLGGLSIAPEATKAVNPWYQEPQDYSEDFKRLQHEFSQAKINAFRKEKDRDAYIATLLQGRAKDKAQLAILQDSLRELGYRPTGVTIGEGSGTVSGSPELKDSTFQDNFIFGTVGTSGGKPEVRYEFSFEISEITSELISPEGKHLEIYQVSIRSLRDPNDERVLGNYIRQIALKIPDMPHLDRWYSNDVALNGDFIWTGDFLEGGLSLSFFTWTTGGLEPDRVIARLPEVGLSTNLRESHHISVGVRFNLGRFLPLVRDLYIAPKYSVGIGREERGLTLGVGTTL